MNAAKLHQILLGLSAPLIADACTREAVPVRCAPVGIRGLWPGAKAARRRFRRFGIRVAKSVVCLARPKRFELLTFAFGGQRSIQLSYGRVSP